MELVEHLDEMRTRIGRGIGYILAGAILAWFCYGPIYDVLTLPVRDALKQAGGFIGATGGGEWFFIRCKISLVVGIIVAAPAWLYEIWAFVAPGLTARERSSLRFAAPAAGGLFLVGVGLGYAVMPRVWAWLLSFAPEDTMTLQSVDNYLSFVAKFLLAFGLAFELPLVLLVLVRLGVLSARNMARRWREATLVIFVVSAAATPGGDPISMLVIAIPLVFLYLISVHLARLMEGRARREKERADAEELD
jgi:sec-independent protein translocase protein TatC